MLSQRQRDRGMRDMPPSSMGVFGVAADKTLKVYEQLVHCSVNTASDDITVTLPPAGEAMGLFFVIRADIANSKTVTVADPGASITSVVLNVDNDYCIVFSTGVEYIILKRGSVVVLTDSSGGSATNVIAAATNIDALTDSSGGTADNTVSPLVDITDTDMTPIGGSGMTTAQEGVYDAMVAEVNTAFGVVGDNFKELTDQAITQKALNTVLINAIASIAAKMNIVLNSEFNNA